MNKTILTFVPLGGLCNRMRAMASGVHIAKRLDESITVYWNKNTECFADFSELFQPICMDDVKVRPLTFAEFYLLPDRKRYLFLPSRIRKFFFDSQIVGVHERSNDSLIENLRGRIYMISGYSLAEHHPLTELFVPVVEIQDQINCLKAHFSQHVIGIHIRRTDNKQAIEKSKIEDYFRIMDLEIESRPETNFYLATDSREVKQEMIRRYKGRILYHKATLERYSVQGMKDAVTDLWCLSSTKRIIGSYYSSYSDLAAELGGIESVSPFFANLPQ